MPLHRLAELQPGLDPDRVVEVRLRPVSATGRALVDDLEWSAGEGCW